MVLKNKKLIKIGNKGFTLVELMVSTAILAILIAILSSTLNPVAMINKANDAKRKKDLNKIRTAFEEYMNDKKTYPDRTVVGQLMSRNSCGSDDFAPWLATWPCDPTTGDPYVIFIESDFNPKWFKVVTKLQNKSDPSIPSGWYQLNDDYHLGHLTKDDVNYGVSSTNISWREPFFDSSCAYHPENHSMDLCYVGQGGCIGAPGNQCSGDDCYSRNDCNRMCKVTCCGSGCP